LLLENCTRKLGVLFLSVARTCGRLFVWVAELLEDFAGFVRKFLEAFLLFVGVEVTLPSGGHGESGGKA
jgi:hypothetical protein